MLGAGITFGSERCLLQGSANKTFKGVLSNTHLWFLTISIHFFLALYRIHASLEIEGEMVTDLEKHVISIGIPKSVPPGGKARQISVASFVIG